MATEQTLTKLEKKVRDLNEELQIRKESKTMTEACEALYEFACKADEPFSTCYSGTNEFHKNPGGGGGCIIL